MKNSIRSTLFLTLGLALIGSAHADLIASIAPDVATEKGQDVASDAVRVTLTNTGKAPLYVLKWNTPLFGLSEDLFEVSLNGKTVPYTGRLIKRNFPTGKDYVLIEAGQNISGVIELSGAYDMYQKGRYEVSFNAVFQEAIQLSDGRSESEVKEVFEVSSGSTSVSMPSDRISAFELIEAPSSRAVSYSSCSSTRQGSIATAHSSAIGYASNSLSYMNSKTVSTVTTRYKTWFGSATTSRFNAVKSHYSLISDALNNKSVVYDCTCTDSYFAYVYPTQPYKIYLCNSFWSAANTGTDSRAGTIIHEMSHFNVNGGTDDHVYGQSGAKSLATRTPSKAVDNADNHEYFSENTPAQN